MKDTNAIATTLVTIIGIEMDASEVKNWLEAQPDSDRRYTLTVGESSFEIDCYGIVRDKGKYYGNHWIACHLHDLSMDTSYPDDIVTGEGDRQYSVYALEPWQTEALGDGMWAIAVYSDDNGFVGYVYTLGHSAEHLAATIAATYEDEEDDCDSESDS